MFSDHKKEWKNRQKDTRIEKMGMTEDNENFKKYLQLFVLHDPWTGRQRKLYTVSKMRPSQKLSKIYL